MAKSDDILINIKADDKQFQSEVSGVQKKIKSFGTETDKASKAGAKGMKGLVGQFTNLGNVVKGFMAIQIFQFFTNIGKAVLGASAEMENHQIAFESMLGSAEKAKKLLGEIKDFAGTTPFQLPSLITGSKRLLAFGVEADKIVDTMKNLGNAAMGNSETLDRLTLAYGKLKAKGRASLEELNMFTEAGVPIQEELRKQFGVSKAEMFKMITAGKVGFEDVNKALVNMTTGSGKFAGIIEKQSQSLGGLFSTLKDKVGLLALDMGDKLNPAFKQLTILFSRGAEGGGILSKAFGLVATSIAHVVVGLTSLVNLMSIQNSQNMSRIYQERADSLVKEAKAIRDSGGATEKWLPLLKKSKELMLKANEETANTVEVTKNLSDGYKSLSGDQKELTNDVDNFNKKLKQTNDIQKEAVTSVKARKDIDSEYFSFIGNQRNAEIQKLKEQKAKILETYNLDKDQKIAIQQAYYNKLNEIALVQDELVKQKRFEQAMVFVNNVAGTLSQIGQLYAQSAQIRMQEIDIMTDKQISALNKEKEHALKINGLFEKDNQAKMKQELVDLNEKIANEKDAEAKAELYAQRKELSDNIKRATIEEDYKKRELAIKESAEKKKRKIARESAILQKKFAIVDTLITTPQMAVQAFKSLAGIPIVGPALAIAAAAAATGFGIAKLAIIQRQPIPEASRGYVPAHHQMALIDPAESIINRSSSAANADILNWMNQNKGQRVGGSGTTINVQGSIVDTQGLMEIIDSQRFGTAEAMGLQDYSGSGVYK